MEHDVEGVTVSDPFENELEPRPGIVDEIRATMRALQRLQGGEVEVFADPVLRGLGLVVFRTRIPLSGLLILLALSVNSFIYTVAALFGAAVSTPIRRCFCALTGAWSGTACLVSTAR